MILVAYSAGRMARAAALVLMLSLVSAPWARAQVAGLTGTLVVTNKTPSTATIVDVASGRTLATLPTGTNPHEVVLSSDGALAVITDYGGERRTLTVLDVPGLRVARTIDLGEHRAPHGIAFLPGDRLVAVTCEQTRHVVLVDVVDGVVTQAIPTEAGGSHMIGVTADGTRGFTGNMRDHTVSELDLRTHRFVRSFTVPEVPEAINVTPDGREVWVGSNRTGQVSVLDPATGTVTKAAEGLKWPYRMLFTPDGRQVIVPDPTLNEVRFIDRAARREIGKLALPGAPQGVTTTPDGRYLFQSLSGETRVAIIDPSTRTVVGHLPVGATPDGVAFTPRVVEPPVAMQWHTVTPEVLDGKGWADTEADFDRFPARAKGAVRDAVWSLSRQSTGLSLGFTSNATRVRVRWTVTHDRLALPHMPSTGVSGLDLYAKEEGAWRFVGGARPIESPTNDALVIAGMTATPREFRLYLPLYNGVSRLEVGVPEEATFRFTPRATTRPVVVYGTSITQGCCASRPGMSYTAMLGRRLDVPVINLGFSGNGKAEPEVAHLLAELDPAVYVLDSLPNMTPQQVVERMPALIDVIRAAHPRTPIVLVEHLLYPNLRFRPARAADVAKANDSLRQIHEARRVAGDQHITLVPAATLLGDDGDGTVDDSHPTELGFARMADGLEPYLRRALASAR
jgi:YVTN family beta-propeller protein